VNWNLKTMKECSIKGAAFVRTSYLKTMRGCSSKAAAFVRTNYLSLFLYPREMEAI